MHALRRALDAPDAPLGAATVIADRQAVRLRSDASLWVDADQFEQALERARSADDPLWLLQRADELYAGSYLPDDIYEDWAADRRERLKLAWADLRFALARAWEGRGDVESAAASLRQLLQADPCDERAARELMRLLSRQGLRTQAVRVYQALVRALRDDLDVEPSDLTTVLFQTELARSQNDASNVHHIEPRAHNLHAQPGRFIGREREVADAMSLLNRADVRLLTLLGPGGCGKTRLGLELGARLVPEFGRGVWFVDLSGVRTPDHIDFEIGRVLSVDQPAYCESYCERLAHTIGDGDLLLILDNFEQVVEGAFRVSELLAACPNVKVLVTSREPLHVRWEHTLEVPPLDGPPAMRSTSFEEIAAAPAVALFVHRAQAIKPDWRLTRSNATVVARLCQRLDGLPLTIELAAARIKLFTPAAMLGRLDHSLDLLTGLVRDVPERHQALELTVRWSYTLLSDAEQTAFRRVAVFSGGCTLDAAIAVCCDSTEAGVRLFKTLQALVDKSLLRVELHGDSDPRFVMLETIRDFAYTELVKTEDVSARRRRHAEWCAQFVESAEPELSGPMQSDWLERLEREHDNFKAALRWSFDTGDAEPGVRLATALGPFWEIRGYTHEAQQWFDEALRVGSTVNSASRARLACSAGHIAFLRGEDRTARALLEESVQLARVDANRPLIVQALLNLALVALSESDDAAAATLLEEAVQVAVEIGDDRSLAASLHLLGQIAFRAGRTDEARAVYERSLQLRRAEANNWATAQVLCDIGLVLHAQGDASAARALYAEAMTIWRDLADVWGTAYALENVAILVQSSEPEVAARLLAAASAARARVGIRRLPAREATLQATRQTCANILDDSAFHTAWSAGTQADLNALIDQVLSSLTE